MGEGTSGAAPASRITEVDIDFVIGAWRGDEFPTGHAMEGLLTATGWYASVLAGARPVLRTARPTARLRMTEFRGVSTAMMIYDAKPINDLFRRVDDETVLGYRGSRDATVGDALAVRVPNVAAVDSGSARDDLAALAGQLLGLYLGGSGRAVQRVAVEAQSIPGAAGRTGPTGPTMSAGAA